MVVLSTLSISADQPLMIIPSKIKKIYIKLYPVLSTPVQSITKGSHYRISYKSFDLSNCRNLLIVYQRKERKTKRFFNL